jgi:hypothetical protein
MNTIIILFSIFVLISIVFSSSIRRPFNSTKIVFNIFAFTFLVWNLFELYFGIFSKWSISIFYAKVFLSNLTLYTLIVYALHFPNYFRRMNELTFLVLFIGGSGFVLFIFLLYLPYVESNYTSEIYIFYYHWVKNFSRLFSLICIFSFFLISYIKLVRSVQKLKILMFRASILISIAFFLYVYLGFGIFDSSYPNGLNIENSFMNLLFLLIGILIFSQYEIVSFYPGIFSFLVQREFPKLILQFTYSASSEGVKKCKTDLWKEYDHFHWKDILNDFWFGLLIDETLDNALEHGGKRAGDEITVQVFDSKKYLDFYVIDSGKGFEPELIPNPLSPERKIVPSGRGVFLLKKVFLVSWNFLGNEIRVRVPKNSKGLLDDFANEDQ